MASSGVLEFSDGKNFNGMPNFWETKFEFKDAKEEIATSVRIEEPKLRLVQESGARVEIPDR